MTGRPDQALPNVLRDQRAANTLGGLRSAPVREAKKARSIAWLALGLLAAFVAAVILLGLLGIAG